MTYSIEEKFFRNSISLPLKEYISVERKSMPKTCKILGEFGCQPYNVWISIFVHTWLYYWVFLRDFCIGIEFLPAEL